MPSEDPKTSPALSRWTTTSTRVVADTPIFRLSARTCTSPLREAAHDFYVLEAPDWVNVIPLTADGEVVMIRQYRHGRSEETLEIPGGMIDPGDESPAVAAARELAEETGYLARRIEAIGAVAPNPAIQDNLCHSFVATDLHQTGEQHLDDAEDIAVELVPLQDIPRLIRGGSSTTPWSSPRSVSTWTSRYPSLEQNAKS